MTAAAFADRLTLYDRLHAFPSATNAEHAAAIGRCRRWVAKWKTRIGSPPHPDPLVACRSRSWRVTTHRRLPHHTLLPAFSTSAIPSPTSFTAPLALKPSPTISSTIRNAPTIHCPARPPRFGRFCASINAFTPRPAANANPSSPLRRGRNSNSISPIFPQSCLIPRVNASMRAKSSIGSMWGQLDHWR